MSEKPADDKLKHEQVQYLEFLTSDINRAKKFYTESFGWKFTDYGPDYTAFEGDYVDGGFTTGTPVHGSILVILYSDDIAATEAKVKRAGGTIARIRLISPGASASTLRIRMVMSLRFGRFSPLHHDWICGAPLASPRPCLQQA